MRRAVRIGLWAGLAGALGVGLVRAARWFQEVGSPPPPASWQKAEPPPTGTARPEAASPNEPTTKEPPDADQR